MMDELIIEEWEGKVAPWDMYRWKEAVLMNAWGKRFGYFLNQRNHARLASATLGISFTQRQTALVSTRFGFDHSCNCSGDCACSGSSIPSPCQEE